jgi:nucleoside-diphosphate-sugar epimerase
MAQRTVLVVGASGLVGTAAVEAFLSSGDNVIALSRRAPEIASTAHYTHFSVDLTDEKACSDLGPQLNEVTHVVYAAVFELPGLMPGWTDERQMQTNLAMMANVMDVVCRHAKGFRHISFLQGTKAYGAHLHAIRIPARERYPRDNHANFYWLQEDYIRQKARDQNFTFTIWRPQLIVGPNYGVVMNPLPVIGAYAAIRKAEGKPFSYPGGARWVWQATDTRVIAEAMEWAADNDVAKNETYNITNGEVFEWRDPPLHKSVFCGRGNRVTQSETGEYGQTSTSWLYGRVRHGGIVLPLVAGSSRSKSVATAKIGPSGTRSVGA